MPRKNMHATIPNGDPTLRRVTVWVKWNTYPTGYEGHISDVTPVMNESLEKLVLFLPARVTKQFRHTQEYVIIGDVP